LLLRLGIFANIGRSMGMFAVEYRLACTRPGPSLSNMVSWTLSMAVNNPAGPTNLPRVFGGTVRLADGFILQGDPPPTWSDGQRHIWDWNRRHGLAYGVIKSRTDDASAYSKVIDGKTALNV